MTPYLLLTKIVEYLKLYTIAGQVIFGDNVYLVTQLPSHQVSTFANPTAFVIDQGATPFANNPKLLEQYFSVGIFVESVDRFGDQAIRKMLEIENSLIPSLRVLQTLNSEKILLQETGKLSVMPLKSNFPNCIRYWSFSVITAL